LRAENLRLNSRECEGRCVSVLASCKNMLAKVAETRGEFWDTAPGSENLGQPGTAWWMTQSAP